MKGFSLLEVCVCLFVISVGLAGLLQVSVQSVRQIDVGLYERL